MSARAQILPTVQTPECLLSPIASLRHAGDPIWPSFPTVALRGLLRAPRGPLQLTTLPVALVVAGPDLQVFQRARVADRAVTEGRPSLIADMELRGSWPGFYHSRRHLTPAALPSWAKQPTRGDDLTKARRSD
jgi:hypothetical protein